MDNSYRFRLACVWQLKHAANISIRTQSLDVDHRKMDPQNQQRTKNKSLSKMSVEMGISVMEIGYMPYTNQYHV